MDLVTMYLSTGIEGIPYDRLARILEGSDDKIEVKSVSAGIIILSNNKVIKCAENYFTKPGDPGLNKKKLKSANNMCFYTQVSLGLTGKVNNYRCVECLQQCLLMKNSGELVRKY